MHIAHRLAVATAVALAALLPACTRETAPPPRVALDERPDYARPLPPGASALRLVCDPARMPDLASAYRSADAVLESSIDHSLRWFAAPSSRTHFPFEGITHEQAEASLRAMREIVRTSPDARAFAEAVRAQFDVYTSVGCDGRGTVLFTGYYAPEMRASRTRSARYDAPLYARPEDLVTDPSTGAPLGRRRADGAVVSYPTRREIETSGLLAGSELVWLESDLDAYIVHVNGSAKLRLDDGSTLHVGYAGKTDRPYASLGRAMAEAGLLTPGEVTLAGIKRVYRRQPERVRELMHRNENFVFFQEYDGATWPSGSLGVPVTAERSLATDKSIYPRGGLVFVDTTQVTFSEQQRDFRQLMLDQDTGGAIKAPGRADIFMGIGPGAEILAGGQYAEGRLYYLFLKPEHVARHADGDAPRHAGLP